MPISGEKSTTHFVPAKERFKPLAYALLAVALVFLTEQVVEYYAKQATLESEQARLTRSLSNLRGRLEDSFNADLSLLHGLAAVIAEKPDIQQDDFARIARGLITPSGTLRNLSGAPDLVVSLMYPLKGNESAVGLNYRAHPNQRDAALHAMQSGHAVITGPMRLVQGGTGIIVREPVLIPAHDPKQPPRHWGLVSAVIDAKAFYQRSGLQDPEPGLRLAIRLVLEGERRGRVFFGSADVFASKPVIQTLALPDGSSWEIAAVPADGWGKSSQPTVWLIRLAGGLLGLGAVSAIYLTFRNRKRLTQANTLLSTLLATIPDPIWLKNEHGVYLACNPGFEHFLGHAEKEIVGKTDYDFVSAEQAASFRQNDQIAIAKGKPTSNEEWITLRANGQQILVETLKTPMYGPSGELIGVLGIARDITARAKDQDKLRQQKELLDRTGQMAQVGGWEFDVTRMAGSWTDETARIHDLDPSDAVTVAQGLSFYDEPSRVALELAIKVAIEHAEPYDLELEMTTAKGVRKWIRTIGQPVVENGKVVRLEGAIQDISKRKQAELNARRGDLLLESVFQAIPDLFFLMDADGTIRDYRAQHESNLYVPADVFLGKRMQDVLPANLGKEFERQIASLNADNRLVNMEYDLHLPDGLHRFEARLCYLDDSQQCISVVRDITEQSNAKHALQESEARYRSLLEYAPFPVVLTRLRDGILVYGNHRAETQFGLTREKGIGLPASRFYHDPGERDAMLAQLLKEGSIFDVEIQMLDALSRPFWALLSAAVIEFDKEPVIFAAINDITERKRIQAEMELNAKVFEQGSEGIIICDRDCNIISVNRALCDITGYSHEELIGRKPSILKSGRHNEDFYRTIWQQITQQGHWQGEIWNRRKNGEIFPEWLSISAVTDKNGTLTHYIGLSSDITQHKQAEEHIRHLAHFDALTGLPNRALLNERIDFAITLAQRNPHQIALLFLDLDRFKNVNDSLGHQVGDQLLVEVSKRLQNQVREEDTVARLGGDEFILLLPDVEADGAAHVAEKIIQSMNRPFRIGEHELSITPSIGIAMYPANGDNMAMLLQSADSAMYQAKQSGHNTYRFFTPEMHRHANRTLLLENALRRAIDRNELELNYQPQLDLHTNRIIAVEALLRWNHPELGMIPPSTFIPVAEDSGQILPIGEWVLRQAIAQNQAWQRDSLGPLVVAVNLSAVQFRQAHFSQLVGTILDEFGMPAGLLELELTERITMEDPLGAIEIMNRLHALGIKLSIDDFGTGYSSLSYLKRFKISKIKIDQSFVRDITSEPLDQALVDSVISLAKGLKLKTIAEGVETIEQLELLRAKGCDEIQGYYISPPKTAEQITELLRNQHKQAANYANE